MFFHFVLTRRSGLLFLQSPFYRYKELGAGEKRFIVLEDKIKREMIFTDNLSSNGFTFTFVNYHPLNDGLAEFS
jgi:hypothetical protein